MKKNRKYSIAVIASLGIFAAGVSSCSLDLQNPNAYDASNYFTNEEDYPMAMISIQNYAYSFENYWTITGGELRSGIYVSPYTVDGTAGQNGTLINNLFSASAAGISNFGGMSNFILDINNLIYHLNEQEGVVPEAEKNYLLGMAYGMRAYAYFWIHKTYGRAVIRETPDVILGITDPTELYQKQSTNTETVEFIKADIQRSLQCFANSSGYTPSTFTQNNVNGCFYWSEMATNMLAGNVYLWTGKVSTGDWTANPTDVTTAKQYFQAVVNSGKYSLMPTCADVYDVTQKSQNTEMIYASYIDLTVGTTNSWTLPHSYMPSRVTGAILGAGSPANSPYWQAYEADGVTPSANAARAGFYYNPETGKTDYTALWTYGSSFQMWYQYKNEVYYSFKDGDSRKDNFIPYYLPNKGEEKLTYIENFDRSTHYLAGTAYWKFRGEMNLAGTAYVCTNPVIYYRYPEALLCLAEIANYEGDYNTCASYINMVRERAFGENWSSEYAYTPGDFTANETEILQEKTREFLNEGLRWWDLRRMTTVKGGSATDHMVFQPQGNVAYGLELGQYQNVFIKDGTVETFASEAGRVDQTATIYTADQAYMVLLPLNSTLLASDPELEQTPGYE